METRSVLANSSYRRTVWIPIPPGRSARTRRYGPLSIEKDARDAPLTRHALRSRTRTQIRPACASAIFSCDEREAARAGAVHPAQGTANARPDRQDRGGASKTIPGGA